MNAGKMIGLSFMLLGVCGVGFAQQAQPQAGIQAAASDREGIAPVEAPGLGMLPATFEGDLPSADGPRIHYHLDLFAGRVFVLQMSEPGRETPLDQIGTWAVSAGGGLLMLRSAGMTPRLYAIGDADTLHTVDPLAQPMEPPSSYDLTRAEPFAPVEPRLILHGMYGHAGDVGVYQECGMGWRLPVAPEGDGEAMESAYSKASGGSGEPLFVTLVGSIVQRPRANGEGTETSLVVHRFINVWPSESCGLK